MSTEKLERKVEETSTTQEDETQITSDLGNALDIDVQKPLIREVNSSLTTIREDEAGVKNSLQTLEEEGAVSKDTEAIVGKKIENMKDLRKELESQRETIEKNLETEVSMKQALTGLLLGDPTLQAFDRIGAMMGKEKGGFVFSYDQRIQFTKDREVGMKYVCKIFEKMMKKAPIKSKAFTKLVSKATEKLQGASGRSAASIDAKMKEKGDISYGDAAKLKNFLKSFQ